ncbi:DUF5403 family protein [Streptomyces sp. NBC_01198]|uniref:DUF5403 family protein n=1 Tax=Streptomyces sp. NBC_01198 TaxID=2903769 RepID=UPI002E12842A|nr:DUF5403 family protein [Streptomyces sp. NBC_01198]
MTAYIYEGVSGKKLTKLIATLPEVSAALDEVQFEIFIRATQLLADHLYSGAAEIDVATGDVDRYVVLSDELGQKHALSIEYGRAAGKFETTDKNGVRREVKYGAMDGLFILAEASNLPKKRRAKVRL